MKRFCFIVTYVKWQALLSILAELQIIVPISEVRSPGLSARESHQVFPAADTLYVLFYCVAIAFTSSNSPCLSHQAGSTSH